jgi:hypothetical protein
LGSPGTALGNDADTYRLQAELSYARFDDSVERSYITGVLGTYYFNALPTRPRDYPFEATAFVERSASVALDYSRDQRDIWRYGAQVVFRRPDTPLYGEASYGYADFGSSESSTGSTFDGNDRSYGLAAGAYAARNTLVFLDWARRVSRTANFLGSGTFTFETVFVTLGVGAEHLARLPSGQHLALSSRVGQEKLEFDGGREDKNNNISLDATYYPTLTVGLSGGLTYQRGDSEFSEGGTWRLGASWFVNPTAGLSLDFSRFDAKTPDSGFDLLTLTAVVRF